MRRLTRWIVQRTPSGEDRRRVRSALDTAIGRTYLAHEETGRPTRLEEDDVVIVDFPYDLTACRSCSLFNPTPLAARALVQVHI
jgi:hypothetical protein